MAELGLDFEQGARVTTSEKYGDWYRDPWGWPELSSDFASTLRPTDFEIEKRDRKFHFVGEPSFHLFDVPKSFLGTRPAVIQDPASRLAYTTAVISLAPKLHQDLPNWVYGWRFRDGKYQKATSEWKEYRASQANVAEADHAAQTDVTSYFASIEVPRLLATISELAGSSVATSIVEQVLRTHDNLVSRSGLPQRSAASAMLAQIAMSSVDDLIEGALASGELTTARRWMDDISFEGSEPALYRLLMALQERGRQVGLEINTAKTLLATGAESAEKLDLEARRLIQVPKQSRYLRDDYADVLWTYVDRSDLLDAESQVLDDPKHAARSTASLVLRSLIHHEQFDRFDDWARASKYLPHAADNVGRYLAAARAKNAWALITLEGWFVESEESDWPHLDWVSAQHALAIPSAFEGQDYAAILRGWLGSSDNLQKLAVAVQRLSASEPMYVRSVTAHRLDRTADPLLVRLLALGHLASGGRQRTVETALSRRPATELTLKLLRHRDFQLPPVSPDFDPASTADEESDGPDN